MQLLMKFLALQLSLLLFVVNTTTAQYCTNDSRFSEVPYFSANQIDSAMNITYGNALDWQGNAQDLVFNIYYPKLSADPLPLRPFILIVHGGGFVAGSRNDWNDECNEFAKRGFIAATIDYRLGFNCNADINSKEKAIYRAQQDANAALRYAVQNAATLRMDTSWMFIGGGSAGAATSLGLVYVSQAEWNNMNPNISNQLGNLNNSGNALTTTYTLKGVFNNWGGMLRDNIQPEEMLPMVSFHGELDPTVSIDSALGGGCVENLPSYGSRSIHNELIANGVCSDLSVDPTGDHGVYDTNWQGTIFRVSRAACFFKSVFCNTCTNYYSTVQTMPNCTTTGLNATSPQLSNYSVYPNPFHDVITLNHSIGNESFKLINTLGQVLYSGKDITHQDFSTLNPDIYLLLISTPEQTTVMKLVKGE